MAKIAGTKNGRLSTTRRFAPSCANGRSTKVCWPAKVSTSACGNCRYCFSVKRDVTDSGDVENLFKQTLATFGCIDVVVHAAGIMPLLPIAAGDITTFDKIIAVNLRGAFLVLGHAARHIASGGRIIAFSSSLLAKCFPAYGPYIASKAGVEGLVHVLANELRGRNITVNVVAPGPVPTELFLKDKTEAQINEFKKNASTGTAGSTRGRRWGCVIFGWPRPRMGK